MSTASDTFINALVPIVAFFLAKSPEDYTYAIRNSEECWYPPTCAIMTNLIPRLTNKDVEYSRETAMADADATVQGLFARFRQDSLPVIYQPMCQANGYNATTTQLLVNDAYNKTVQDGAKTILDNIGKYAGIRQNDLQVMAQLIGAIKNSLTVGDIYQGQKEDFSWLSSTAKLITGIAKDS